MTTPRTPATVNAAFSQRARRPRAARKVETDEFAAFTRRIIRAYARRVSAGDVEALADLIKLHAELGELVATAAGDLHARGYAWSEIAARTGTSLQAVRQRVLRHRVHPAQ